MKKRKLIFRGSPEERFKLSYKIRDDGCWLWAIHCDSKGYGVMGINNKKIMAHRFSYELYVGKIPEKMVVCHKCDNPSCVNPDHLWVGTQRDNIIDMVKKGRSKHPIGEKNHLTKLSRDEVINIKCSLLNNVSGNKLAKKYGVTRTSIYKIKNGVSWNWLKIESDN